MRRRERNIQKEGPRRIDLLLPLHPRNRMVGEVVGYVIVRISRARHEVMVLEEDRLKLTRIAAIEAIEIIETKAAGPVVERTDFAGLPCRSVVVLADPRGRIPVLLQD